MMRKYKKKDLKRDEFKETIENTIIFYEHHKKIIAIAAVGIIVIAISLIAYRNHARATNKRARSEYNIGVVVYNSGQIEQAEQQFEMIRNEFWGTTFAHRATFMLANIYYKKGQLDKAIENFEEFSNGKYDKLFTPSSYQGIAQCYEQKGNIVKALEYYEKALLEFKANTFKTDCLMQMGRIYLSMNRLDAAKDVYEEILNLTDNPTIRYKAERKLKTIEAIKEISE
ncbi:tetratricopeptide repeat protein [candidate division WOR-3 bacterium]|nr:tetratricopeptide repeat protein [candidate division WOR-3 bacterium]